MIVFFGKPPAILADGGRGDMSKSIINLIVYEIFLFWMAVMLYFLASGFVIFLTLISSRKLRYSPVHFASPLVYQFISNCVA